MNAENQIQYILLGAVLTFHEHADVLQDLEIEDFCPELQRTFADISGFWQCRDKWDALSVMEFYPDDKVTMLQCTEAFGAEFIRNVTHDMMQGWARIIKEQAALSRVRELAFKIADSSTTYEDLAEIYEQMGESLNLHSEQSDFLSTSDGIDDYIRHRDDKPKYIHSGLKALDNNLHMVPGNFIIIGGRPSAGKTALSLQMAADMAAQGYKVCYFSLETDPNTLIERTISNRLRIPLHVVKNKNVSTDELDRLADVKKTPVYFRSAAGKGVGWIRTQSVRMRADIVFVDYLQLIHQAGAKDRYGAITEISIALHEFAQATHTLVIALAQLNRDTARTGAIPTSADLRESGQIEQDADAIILLASDVVIKDHPERKYYFGLAKNKEGDTGDLLITFNKPIQRFEEYEW